MPMVFAAIAPHGFPIIPELSDDAEGGLATREAMHELGRRCAAARPDVIVVAGPHGVRVDGAICLADVARGAGTLRWHGRQVEMNVPVDGRLTDAVAEAAGARGVPIAMAGFAGNRRFQAAMPLDWGVITPLWFLGQKHARKIADAADIVVGHKEDFERSGCALTVDFKIGFHDCLLQYSESRDSPHYSELNICRRLGF